MGKIKKIYKVEECSLCGQLHTPWHLCTQKTKDPLLKLVIDRIPRRAKCKVREYVDGEFVQCGNKSNLFFFSKNNKANTKATYCSKHIPQGIFLNYQNYKNGRYGFMRKNLYITLDILRAGYAYYFDDNKFEEWLLEELNRRGRDK